MDELEQLQWCHEELINLREKYRKDVERLEEMEKEKRLIKKMIGEYQEKKKEADEVVQKIQSVIDGGGVDVE